MGHVSDIKLIRTDTTLDLSQKAEKGMHEPLQQAALRMLARHRPTPLCSLIYGITNPPHLLHCFLGLREQKVYYARAFKFGTNSLFSSHSDLNEVINVEHIPAQWHVEADCNVEHPVRDSRQSIHEVSLKY